MGRRIESILSSKFHHGKTVAEVDGNYYKIDHGKIYKTDAIGSIKYDDETIQKMNNH